MKTIALQIVIGLATSLVAILIVDAVRSREQGGTLPQPIVPGYGEV
jgi:hypothetical protein